MLNGPKNPGGLLREILEKMIFPSLAPQYLISIGRTNREFNILVNTYIEQNYQDLFSQVMEKLKDELDFCQIEEWSCERR